MSQRLHSGDRFFVDSQTNEFVCMTCAVHIRRPTDGVNEDPETAHQALDIDCRRTPSVDGPHIPPNSGLHDLARRCKGLRIPFYVPRYKANPDDVMDMLRQKTVQSLIVEAGFELDVFRRIIIRQLETKGGNFSSATELMASICEVLDARFT